MSLLLQNSWMGIARMIPFQAQTRNIIWILTKNSLSRNFCLEGAELIVDDIPYDWIELHGPSEYAFRDQSGTFRLLDKYTSGFYGNDRRCATVNTGQPLNQLFTAVHWISVKCTLTHWERRKWSGRVSSSFLPAESSRKPEALPEGGIVFVLSYRSSGSKLNNWLTIVQCW